MSFVTRDMQVMKNYTQFVLGAVCISFFKEKLFSVPIPERDFFSALLQTFFLEIVSCSLLKPLKLNHESFIDTPCDAGETCLFYKTRSK